MTNTIFSQEMEVQAKKLLFRLVDTCQAALLAVEHQDVAQTNAALRSMRETMLHIGRAIDILTDEIVAGNECQTLFPPA
jgi:hypothetical protein